MPKSVSVEPGDKYGSWTVVFECTPGFRKSGLSRTVNRKVKVKCSCGTIAVVPLGALRQGRSTRCVECGRDGVRKHGMSKSVEYKIWRKMIERCYNKNSKNYKFYGERGVIVCDRWNPHKGGSFQNFYEDMGARPSPSHQLDKEAVFVENNVYGPGLVKWTLKIYNQKNKKNLIRVRYCGIVLGLNELSEISGIPYELLRIRIRNNNLSPEQAVQKGYRPLG